MQNSNQYLSNYFWQLCQQWTSITFRALKTILEIRTLFFWTNALAHKRDALSLYALKHYKVNPQIERCPLCSNADSIGHMLSECKSLHHLRVQRHDCTARLKLKHIRKRQHCSSYLLADVGSPSILQEFDISGKQIPQWILPGPPTSEFDILMVHTPINHLPPTLLNARN